MRRKKADLLSRSAGEKVSDVFEGSALAYSSILPQSGGVTTAGPQGFEPSPINRSGEPATAAHDDEVRYIATEAQKAYGGFITGLADWQTFITFTTREKDRVHRVTRSEMEFCIRRWIQILNADLFGKNYTRAVHHSYFAYAIGFEGKPWGLEHAHGVIAGRINYQLAIRVWSKMMGYIKIEKIERADLEARVTYVCKYATKEGDVMLYRPDKPKEPSFKPAWYQAS